MVFPFLYENCTFLEMHLFLTLLATPFDTLCYQNGYMKRRVLISIFVTLLRTRF